MDVIESAIVDHKDKYTIYSKSDKNAKGRTPYEGYTLGKGYHGSIVDVLVDPKIPYMFEFVDEPQESQSWLKEKGAHGFNNYALDMSAAFVAKGPAFKRGYQSDSLMQNVHVYELLCHLLCDVEPAPNNGSLSGVSHVLI